MLATATRDPWPAFLLMAAGVLLAWDASGLDLFLVQVTADAEGFPWRHHWFLSTVLHQGGRVAAWGFVAWIAVSTRWPLRFRRAS